MLANRTPLARAGVVARAAPPRPLAPAAATEPAALPAVDRRAALALFAAATAAAAAAGVARPPSATAAAAAEPAGEPAAAPAPQLPRSPAGADPADPPLFTTASPQDITQPIPPANIDPARAPDPSAYDPADPRLREAARLMQAALAAADVREEEALWTRVVDDYSSPPNTPAASRPLWEDDVVGRALGNRGNARSRQGKLNDAVGDYNAAIARCPWSVDPVLNRGVALEAAGRLTDAAADYRAILRASPSDPSAWNNLGNTRGKQGAWREARDCFARAAELAPRNAFAFAVAQRAVVDFQLGDRARCVRDLRALLRRFAEFDDARAALAAALWAQGDEAAAEGEWLRVGDPRYRDLAWVRARRAWPPALADALASFLSIQTVAG